MPQIFTGRVESFDQRGGYGYIHADDGQGLKASDLLLVHRQSLRDRFIQLRPGDRVEFSTEIVPTGTLATDVRLSLPSEEAEPLDRTLETSAARTKGPEIRHYLSAAIFARDQKHYEEAAALYRKGMESQPTVALVLSYAAMEKNRNRRADAMRVYQQGLKLFPSNAKLWEDAGALHLSSGELPNAIQHFERALNLSIRARQGTKGVLLKLAQANYQLNTFGSLKKSVDYYRKAQRMGRNPLSSEDSTQMNLAAVRIQHQRGNVSATFLEGCGFRIARANLLSVSTEGADFFIQVDHPELTESYGLAGHLLVRCYFKTNISTRDLQNLDDEIIDYSRSDLIDEQVAFVVVSSLPEDLQRMLAGRIEQKNRPQPAIVPLTQSDMETAVSPLDSLRATLDRWLYKRDLFATNSPVSGSKFFGRDKPLAELRDAISSSTCAGVYGLRKVGKTSLLQECKRRSTQFSNVVVYIDLLRLPSDVTDCRWLYWRIANSLREEAGPFASQYQSVRDLKWRLGGVFPDFQDIPSELPVATAFDSDISRFTDALARLPVTPKPSIVLLLDEIERLLPSTLGKPDFTGYFDFFSYMRGLNQEKPQFVMIVAGANASLTETAQFDGRDNPVFNYFREIYLPHLEEKECDRMVTTLGRGMGLRFTDNAEERVYQLTGGHPFFARQLCSYLAEIHPERPTKITESQVLSSVESYLDLRSSHFGEIVERLRRDYPEELRVCEELARAGGVLPVDRVRKLGRGETIKHLTGYQIVRMQDSKLYLSMQLLTKWLQKRSGSAGH